MRFAILLVLLSACAAPSVAVQKDIEAYGFATGMENQALARTTAANRALLGLAKLARVDSVRWQLEAAADGASVVEVRAEGTAEGSAEHIEVSGTEAAIARGQRSDEDVRALSALPMVEVDTTVWNADPAKALALAEKRAVAGAIVATRGKPPVLAVLSGRLSVGAMKVDLVRGGVHVHLRANVVIDGEAPLTNERAAEIATEAAFEREELGAPPPQEK